MRELPPTEPPQSAPADARRSLPRPERRGPGGRPCASGGSVGGSTQAIPAEQHVADGGRSLCGNTPPGVDAPGAGLFAESPSRGGDGPRQSVSAPLTMPTTDAEPALTSGEDAQNLGAGAFEAPTTGSVVGSVSGDDSTQRAHASSDACCGSGSPTHAETDCPEVGTGQKSAMDQGKSPTGPACREASAVGAPTVPAPHTGECSMCGRPHPGLTCERCMRYELSKPAILATYSRAELEELADSALDAMRFWLSAEASLRVMAAKRAE